MRLVALALALTLAPLAGASPDRSKALRVKFQRANPCPSTGLKVGPCPGWQVDHRDALVCGGRDELGNLQWLPVAEHQEKTRVEVKLCRRR